MEWWVEMEDGAGGGVGGRVITDAWMVRGVEGGLLMMNGR